MIENRAETVREPVVPEFFFFFLPGLLLTTFFFPLTFWAYFSLFMSLESLFLV